FDSREQCNHVGCRKDGSIDSQRSGFNAHSRRMSRARKNTFKCLPARSSASGQYPVVVGQLSQRYLASASERVLVANEDGIRVREQKLFLEVGRPRRAPEHPEQEVEIAGSQRLE